MGEVLELISNYGIGFVCVGYLIYFQSTTMKTMNDTLLKLSENIVLMNERLSEIEQKVG